MDELTVGIPGTDPGEDEEEELAPAAPAPTPVYVTLLSDAMGNRPVDIAPLIANLPGGTITIRNVLGYAQAEPGGTAQIFLNNQVASLDSPVVAGDLIYVAGKLAGG